MNILFLGAPGSGKGTQARLLIEKFKFIQLSTGDLLREAISANTDLGLKAKLFMDKGQLVPDFLIVDLVKAFCKSKESESLIFDGFPRTVDQAEQLAEVLTSLNKKVDFVIYFKINPQILIKRLTGRRTCKACGEIYHVVTKKPLLAESCDKCGGLLVQRNDDREDIIGERLAQFEKNTEPTIQYYRKNSCFFEVESEKSPESVFEELIKILSLDN